MTTTITENQWLAIILIYENLQIEFDGETKQDARIFINRHIEDSKQSEADEIMAHVQYEEHGFI
ncbi:hypothetical protein [Psychrobacillus sp. FSL H8-0510]|uniref:hypothetical protein n=1 Tax=Psychrobacillus sp. FSL H8-0510 TaxID=2921394 RepID=UPI0030F8C5BE